MMKGLQASLHDIKLLQLKAPLQPTETSQSLSARPIFLGWDPGNGWRDDDAEATAHLGGHLPPLLAPCFSQLQLCVSGAENQASSAQCW